MSRRLRLALISLAVIAAGVLAASAAAIAFTDESCANRSGCSPPEGSVGQSYLHTVQIRPGGGTAPYSYTVISGALPPGLSLGSSSGQITGKPTASGSYTFFIEGADSCPDNDACINPKNPPTRFPQETTQRDFTINILSGVSIDQNSVPGGTIGAAYSQQLTATLVTSLPPADGSPKATATWTVASGTLPPGVALGTNGLLSGTPTAEGSYTFVVRAELDPSRFDTETETIVVRQPVTVGGQGPGRSEVGVHFDAALTASGGTGTFTWALAGGTLPQGVTLAPTGALSGTPREDGRFAFTAKATDTEGRSATVDGTIVVSPRVSITTRLLRPAKAGRLYRARIVATGGVIPKTWKIKLGRLPHGVRLDRKSGILSGTPRGAGLYRITAQVTDGFRITSTRALRLAVLPAAKR